MQKNVAVGGAIGIFFQLLSIYLHSFGSNTKKH